MWAECPSLPFKLPVAVYCKLPVSARLTQVPNCPPVYCVGLLSACGAQIRWGAGQTRPHCGRNIADVIIFHKCRLVLPCEQHLCPTQILCPGHINWNLQKHSLGRSARRATKLPRFATDGQHRRTQCCRHDESSFCRGLRFWQIRFLSSTWILHTLSTVFGVGWSLDSALFFKTPVLM